MLNITYAPGDSALAARLQNDLQQLPADTPPILIVLLSPEAEKDQSVQQAIYNALDTGQYIIPVLAKPAAVPKLIDHLDALDFSSKVDRDALIARIAAIETMSTEGRLPLKVRTPAVRASNRVIGYALIVLVIGLFILSVLAVGGGIIGFPQQEYAEIDAEVNATIQAYIRANLPRSTDDALNFPATVQAAPTAQRPLLIATATAMAAENP